MVKPTLDNGWGGTYVFDCEGSRQVHLGFADFDAIDHYAFNPNPRANAYFRDLIRLYRSLSGTPGFGNAQYSGLSGSLSFLEGRINKKEADERENSSDYAKPVGPRGGVRGFFSGDSSAPLSAQIGAIVVLAAVASIGLFYGISGKRITEVGRSIYICGSIGLLALLVWLTSPITP
jgi:hypothetical protein